MDDRELAARGRRFLEAEIRMWGTSHPAARVLDVDGVVASVNPQAPDRSLFNAVIAAHPEALAAAYDRLAASYRAAGVRAWTVWIDPRDQDAAALLAGRGHLLDARPRAMGAALSELALPEVGDLDWAQSQDVAELAAINDQAYGFPPPAFAAAMVQLPDRRWRIWIARDAGAAVASVLTFDGDDGNVGISGVASLPAARGGRYAGRLLAAALGAAEARGARTTTLQATSKGAPVYARLGYRDLGELQMWEHRVPAPAAPP